LQRQIFREIENNVAKSTEETSYASNDSPTEYPNRYHYLLHFYYALKLALPAGIRLALRQYHAIPLKWSSAAPWPINKASIGKPENWPGWPDGTQFAFVLSYDVEGKKGLKRCRALAELEMNASLPLIF
jgi:hypothetical protein